MLRYLTPSVDKWPQSCGKGTCFGDRLPVSPEWGITLWNGVRQYLAVCNTRGIDIRLVTQKHLWAVLGSPASPQSIRLSLGTATRAIAAISSVEWWLTPTAMGVSPISHSRPHIHRLYYD